MFERLLELSTLFFEEWLFGHLDRKWTMSYLNSKNFVVFQVFHNLINGTHSSITKHVDPFSEYYYYHKTWDYSLVCQVVVHDKKQFTNLFVRLPRNVNDSRVFKRSSFYNKTQYHGLFNLDAKMIYLLICLEIRNIPC